MTEHKLEITEGAEAVDNPGASEAAPRNLYRITDKVLREATNESVGSEGLFKNGRLYTPGETIELDEKTAAGFLALEQIVGPVDDGAVKDDGEDAASTGQPGDVVQPTNTEAHDA